MITIVLAVLVATLAVTAIVSRAAATRRAATRRAERAALHFNPPVDMSRLSGLSGIRRRTPRTGHLATLSALMALPFVEREYPPALDESYRPYLAALVASFEADRAATPASENPYL